MTSPPAFSLAGSATSAYRSSGADEPQTFEAIKQECIDSGALWEDPDFPAEDASMFYETAPAVGGDIEWKRPSVSYALAYARLRTVTH